MKLYRIIMIWVFGRCPHCWSRLVWGQWNDGSLAGRPFCWSRACKPGWYTDIEPEPKPGSLEEP